MATTPPRQHRLPRSVTSPYLLLAFILLALALLISTVGCFAPHNRGLLSSIESGRVVIAVPFDQPGLGFRTSDTDTPTGIDPDVATHIVNGITDKHGWSHPEIIWQDAPPPIRENLLKTGSVDLVASGYTITTERAELISFAGPYLATHVALLVRDGVAPSAAQSPLCTVSGTTTSGLTTMLNPDAPQEEFDNYNACVEAVLDGRVAGLVSDAAILYGLAKQRGDALTVTDISETSIPDNLSNDTPTPIRVVYGIGLPKEDTDAKDHVNAMIETMFADGTLQRLIEQHFGENATKVFPEHPGDYPDGYPSSANR